MSNEKNELEILFPHNPITLAGEQINILPFKFGRWPEVIKKATRIIKIIIDAFQVHGAAALDIAIDDENDNFRISPEAFNLIVELLTNGGEEVLDILAISADKPRSWINNLDGDEGVQLLAGTYFVNRDFFKKRVLPQFLKMSAGLIKSKALQTQELPLPGEE